MTLTSSARWLLPVIGILMGWHLLITITSVPAFIFPGPFAVLRAIVNHHSLLLSNMLVTAAEIIAGLLIGCTLGIASAVMLTLFQSSRRWAMPLMVMSQSLPVFALAPLLTLWFGYGMGSKIVMATLIIYFPVVAATFDGLRHTPESMVELAHTMRATRWSILRHIRLPAALPSIASGIRVATSVAPIGAVVGEWVGSSKGLGYLMLQANGRMQTDLLFAALLCLCLLALLLYVSVNRLLDHLLYWQSDTSISSAPKIPLRISTL